MTCYFKTPATKSLEVEEFDVIFYKIYSIYSAEGCLCECHTAVIAFHRDIVETQDSRENNILATGGFVFGSVYSKH